MKAQTFGYLVKGPRELPADRAPAYAAAAEGVRRLQAIDAQPEISAEDRAFLSTYGIDPDVDLARYERMQAETIVNAIYRLWTAGTHDSVKHADPDDETRAILFAGGGAEDYDDGAGWLAIRDGYVTGVLHVLGIR